MEMPLARMTAPFRLMQGPMQFQIGQVQHQADSKANDDRAETLESR